MKPVSHGQRGKSMMTLAPASYARPNPRLNLMFAILYISYSFALKKLQPATLALALLRGRCPYGFSMGGRGCSSEVRVS